jgi:ATP-dependent Clp protease ATP-binding subunit ClpC
MIVMTSNLGAREMAKNDIGFGTPDVEHAQEVLKLKAMSAVKSKFSPEFMNRLQHIVMFQPLTEQQIAQVLEMELDALSARIAAVSLRFSVVVSPKAKQKLLAEGYSKMYGARYLKRTIEKYIERLLAKMINTQQIMVGDTVVVDYVDGEDFEFYTHSHWS